MQGGVDALSLLAPAGNPLYVKLRPTLAVKPGSGTPFREDPSLTFAFIPRAAGGELKVEAEDNDNRRFESVWPVKPGT